MNHRNNAEYAKVNGMLAAYFETMPPGNDNPWAAAQRYTDALYIAAYQSGQRNPTEDVGEAEYWRKMYHAQGTALARARRAIASLRNQHAQRTAKEQQ